MHLCGIFYFLDIKNKPLILLIPMTPSIDLTTLAKRSMIEYKLLPDFPPQVTQEVNLIKAPAQPDPSAIKDMRQLLWFSLDNDDSQDLDQLTYAELINDKTFKIYIAIADVDSLVKRESATDHYAKENTTSVYTPTKVFTMLPQKLCYDFTSLNEHQNRLAIVADIEVKQDGSLGQSFIYQAYVYNHAKLAYPSISSWLDERTEAPASVQKNSELDQQVRLQDKIAKLLRQYRHEQGALTLETIEPSVVFDNQKLVAIKNVAKNRGRDLIEDFMIAANRATANFLNAHKIPSFRRIVRTPKRWDRIVEIAKEHGGNLPSQPDAKALDQFLTHQRLLNPLRFPDLSLIIIKLLGNGEYVVEYPGEKPIGHFSLAVKNYTHSTAPNRRYPDLITQRLIKSVLNNSAAPYQNSELEKLAAHCTEQEDNAEKVERKMKKSAACVLLSSKINQTFDALVTGASSKGTWVRLLEFPIEGKLIDGFKNIDVGDQIRVKLVHVDIEKGFIDFIRIN